MLEDHESEPAHQMKAEIRTRFRDGHTELEIERTLRERHGDDIVSVPLDHDPRTALSSILVVLLASSALLLLIFRSRWRSAHVVHDPCCLCHNTLIHNNRQPSSRDPVPSIYCDDATSTQCI